MPWMTTRRAAAKLPAILLRRTVSFTFDGIPLRTEKLSGRQTWNLIQAGLDQGLQRSRMRSLPPIVHFESANYCNLRCPLCPTGTGEMPRPPARMDYATFEAVFSGLREVLIYAYFFSFGEPFLNPELPRMIRACADRGIGTLSSTNGHGFRTIEDALEVVDSGLTTLIYAVDGSTQEVYESYRTGGCLATVKASIRLVEEAKRLRRSKTPYTVIRSVVTSHNAADLPELESLAEGLDVDMFATKDLGCLVGSRLYQAFEPREEGFRRFGSGKKSPARGTEPRCIFPFRQPVILVDGSVVGCEYDLSLSYVYGNAASTPFRDLWNSPNARALRRSVLGRAAEAEFCRSCPFRGRARDGRDISIRAFRQAPR